jgi:hypothetical protein
VATSTVEFVESAFPLVLVRLPHAVSAAELRVLFAGFDRVQARVRDRAALYYVVVDALALGKLPNPLERKMLTDWMSEPARTELEQQYSLGSAVAMSSRPVRAVLTALNWIRRPPKPQVVVETVVEAIDVGLERRRDANIPLTPAMQMLRAHENVRSPTARR